VKRENGGLPVKAHRTSTFVLSLLAFFPVCWACAQSAPEWSKLGIGDKATELMTSQQFADAIPAARAQLDAAEARVGKNHPDLLTHLQTLGTAYFARQDFDEAEIVYRRGLGIVQQSLGASDPRVMEFAGVLFAIYRIQNRPTEAAAMWKLTNASQ
jgi:tetratricopeptide (TPR) repeat protein